VDIENLVAAGIPWPLFLRDCLRLEIAPFVLFSLVLAQRLLGTPIPAWVMQEIKGACTPRQLRALSIHRRCMVSLDSSSVSLHQALQRDEPVGLRRQPWRAAALAVFQAAVAALALGDSHILRLRKDSPWVVVAYLLNPCAGSAGSSLRVSAHRGAADLRREDCARPDEEAWGRLRSNFFLDSRAVNPLAFG